MNINSYIYMNSGLEVRDVGVGTDINKTPNTVRQDVAQKLKTNPYLSPLSSDLILYNNFNSKDQGTGTAVLAYYYQSIHGSKGVLSVYKKLPEDDYYTYICDMHGNYAMLDYGVKANAYYHYLIAYRQGTGSYKIYEDTLTDADGNISPAYLHTKWDFWTICDIEETENENLYEKTGDTWKIAYNMDNGTLTQNTNVTAWDTLGRFPKFSIGKKNYVSGSMSCLLGDITQYVEGVPIIQTSGSSEKTYFRGKSIEGYTERTNKNSRYSREVEKYDAWKAFVNDGKLKLMKDYKGNAWVIQIATSPSATIDMQSNLLETTIAFDWQEALDIDKIFIVSSDR